MLYGQWNQDEEKRRSPTLTFQLFVLGFFWVLVMEICSGARRVFGL